ncbi:MAG: hypothetical protein JRN25_04760 [Nitrososphaerota archaeon]|nr:hypothetical protein [Nitrososphaerota archaeon]
MASLLRRLNISLPTKGTNWMITEPASEGIQILGVDPNAQPIELTASERIRAEVRSKVLPKLREAGQYPGDPKVYVPILKDLAQRYKVDYNTVMASWRKCWKVVPQA